MEPRKAVEKVHPKLSPSPEMPTGEQAQLRSLRSSRASSEARSEQGPAAPFSGSFQDAQMAACRSSRAGSEAPQRESVTASPSSATRRDPYASYRSSRAGSEVPDRGPAYEPNEDRSARSSRADSEVPERGGYNEPAIPSPKRTPGKTKQNLMMMAASTGSRSALRSIRAGGAVSGAGKSGHRADVHGGGRAPQSVREHIHNVEQRLYGTVHRATTTFQFYQKLHYPLEYPNAGDEADVAEGATVAEGQAYSESMALPADPKEPSPQPRFGSHNAAKSTELMRGTPSPAACEDGDNITTAPGGAAGASASDPRSSTSHSSVVAGAAAAALMGNLSSGCGGSSNSPSPCFDEAAFNASFENTGFLDESGDMLSESFRAPLQTDGEDSALQSVSVVAMATLLDPMSGAPVLGLCLGDYSGHIEYFEVSTADTYNSSIRRSKSLMQQQEVRASPAGQMHGVCGKTRGSLRYSSDDGTGTSATPNKCGSLDSAATENITHDMRGREVLRRHSHKAFVKSINALTSVAVEPYVKCLTFVRQRCSPSMISYLTANERVIKLFHVRREGFSPFNAFAGMEEVIGKTFAGSRYFARLPPQPAILPIKEFGPVTNSIQALSVSADGETFMSVEDLQVFWWSFEATDTTKATCIADLRPPSGALDEVEELVTASSFHPTHSSLFLLTRSSGILNIGDLRDPPSRESRKYAISSQLTTQQNPFSCQAYDEILCSISGASFLGPDHVVTRDYLSLKLWDLRKPDQPCAMMPVMNYVSKYLDSLYENDSIFDRFPVAVDDISGTVVTGLYDSAVAVWQPLHSSLTLANSLVHYRADPFVEPDDAVAGGVVGVQELEKSLADAWSQTLAAQRSSRPSSQTIEEDGFGMGVPEEAIPEPFTNKVLTVAIAPGGERFCYTYKNGRLVYVFERKSDPQ
ncbi:hypothetical protein conserved [Leishmania donovani]|uniref:Uncharacterized protein n=3 Tax=Leishmania donovani species complex TaxID=38574 RepID=A4I7Y0_LEIIN|nr:conserved hypothetical protein [Leishmania infantum JPCM5]TPP47178.1 hypothetical protein CGC20_34165 [Leishmania donovani]CAC9524954.1 hypothetical_protein_-_conserved [Leishmania infantum]CAJ1991705.1 hypothetical protein conserved [Leishmania donovani]CAM70917.1 conserved hypothetical protein [Leishmania infantum JPCM5]SUZ44737.1 hypothetical_protein_-_conserved [Leishmania infantum]|eukprot:XP_001467849.1 conserved hypothetical protein [Leishmania infantum JPCM5]